MQRKAFRVDFSVVETSVSVKKAEPWQYEEGIEMGNKLTRKLAGCEVYKKFIDTVCD